MRPRLLDLFCGAGGAAKGYMDAGFHVTGVDIAPQPNYCGERFIQADVLEFLDPWHLRLDFDAAHASPPCQFATAYKRTGTVGLAPNLIPDTRHLLEGSELPFVIENVEMARDHLIDPVLLCGSMFDGDGMKDVQRHRLLEANWPLEPPAWPCRHKVWASGRYPASTNRAAGSRRTMQIGQWSIPLAEQKAGMGVDWDCTLDELSNMVPPAYTEFIGHQLLAHLGRPPLATAGASQRRDK